MLSKEPGVVHVAMEMLEGETLRKVLDRGPLPVARAIGIAHDIASYMTVEAGDVRQIRHDFNMKRMRPPR